MAYWTFPTNRQGWGPDDSVWTDEEGRPAGCLRAPSGVDRSGLSVSVTPASPCSFWAKIVWDSEDELEGSVNITVGLSANDDLVVITASRTISTLPYDSGWFKVSGNASDTGTVTGLGLTVGADMPDWPGLVYFDSVYVAESEPGGWELTHSGGGVPGAVMA